jgi:hypothetical protein
MASAFDVKEHRTRHEDYSERIFFLAGARQHS